MAGGEPNSSSYGIVAWDDAGDEVAAPAGLESGGLFPCSCSGCLLFFVGVGSAGDGGVCRCSCLFGSAEQLDPPGFASLEPASLGLDLSDGGVLDRVYVELPPRIALRTISQAPFPPPYSSGLHDAGIGGIPGTVGVSVESFEVVDERPREDRDRDVLSCWAPPAGGGGPGGGGGGGAFDGAGEEMPPELMLPLLPSPLERDRDLAPVTLGGVLTGAVGGGGGGWNG